MPENKNFLKEWMDRLGLQAKVVAMALHVEEQTVRNWRSSGVPARRLPHVMQMIEDWDSSEKVVPLEDLEKQTLVLRPTTEQFRKWEAAAHKSGEVHLEEWIKKALEEMSREENVIPMKIAAEEPAEFGKKSPATADGGTCATGSRPRKPPNGKKAS